MWRPERIDCETRKAISTAGVIRISVVSPKTTALPQSTGRRRGTAVIEARIIPVEYSAVITSTPSTPIASWAIWTPTKLTSSGWKSARSLGLAEGQWCETTAAAIAGTPIVNRNAAASDHFVERTERSFVSSERKTRSCVTRPVCSSGGMTWAWASVLTRRPPPGSCRRRESRTRPPSGSAS